MAYVKHHGIQLANGANIKNAVIERVALLANEPDNTSPVGRLWYSDTDKVWKAVVLDGTGASVIRKFATQEDVDAYKAALLATATGSTLIGYDGHEGVNNQFDLAAGTIKAALDAIAIQIDANSQSISDIGNGNLVELQDELDTTQLGAGLSVTGTYVIPTTSNYLNSTTSLASADAALDVALKAEVDARTLADTNIRTDFTAADNTERDARILADTTIRDDFASVAAGKGASTVGVQDASDKFTATTVEGVLAELQDNIDAEIAALTLQAVYDTSPAVGSEVIVKLAEGKKLKFLDNNDSTYFMLDPDADNPINISMTGPVDVQGSMTISGDLTISGATTQVDSVVTNSDHLSLKPAGAAVALEVVPDAGFTGNVVVDIKTVNGGASVLSIDKTDATVKVTKLNASSAAVFNDSVSLNGAVTVAAGQTVSFGANKLTNVAAGTVATDAVNKGQLDAAISSGGATQSELDVSQASVGLETDGTYVAPVGTNYLGSAATVKAATVALDTALKAEVDARTLADTNIRTDFATADTSIRTDFAAADLAIQNELDLSQASVGLNTDGTYTAPVGTNYLGSAVTVKAATVALDTALKAEVDARTLADTNVRTDFAAADLAIQNELDVTQAGAGLAASGAYVVPTTSNYLNSTTSLASADAALDVALKAEVDARTLADTAIRSDINALNFTYKSVDAAAYSHTVVHGLGTDLINFTVLVKDGTVYRNDIVAVTVLDANSIKVELTEEKDIIVVITKVTSI